MATDNGGSLSFEVKLMLDKLQADVKKANAELAKIGKTATDEGKKIDNAFSGIGKSVASIGAAFSAQQLARQIIQVRGEFEKLEVSFNTMLRSEEKATALMNQLVKTAATTPFGLQDVAGGAKQLLAYGMEAEKINETLIRLGDIAAGLNIPLQDMTYLFGTTMVQGRMYTQDLNQFVGRGIPLIKEFANQFGVAESKVKDLVTEGKIGFPQLQKAIIAMTSEGGQFAGLMEAQSKTIAGQIANLQDSIDMMFNEIGQASEGIISGSIEVVASLVENYEQVGRVLLSLVGVYGVYKTAVIAMTAVYTAQAAGIGALTLAEKLHYTWLVLVEKAQKILNATMLTNPYVLVATAVAGLVAYLVSLKTETELIAEANEKYEESKRKQIEAEEEHMRKMNELIDIAGNEALSTDTRRNALVKLEMQYPSIFAQYDTEYEKLKNIKKIKEEIAALEAGKSIQNVSNELDRNLKRIAELEAKAKTKQLVGYDASGMAIYEGGLSAQERAELKALQEKNKELEKINKQKQREQYLTNLNVVGEKTLNAEIQARKDLLARMKVNGKSRGKITGNLAGEYSSDELQAQLNLMESELKRRKSPQKTAAEWKKYYQDQYEAKRKAYNDYLKQSGKIDQTTFETEAKRLKDEMDAAKKEVDNYKPSVNKGAARQAQQAKKEAEKRLKLQQELADDLLQMQQDNEQREIDAMDEGTAKRLAQINHDFEVRRKEIEKQEKDWKKQNIEAGITTEENGLTKEQSDALADAYAQNVQQQAKAQAELRKEEQQAMRDYLKEYGEYQEKRLAITEDYAERIKKAQNDGERKTLEAERDKALADLDTQATKTTSAIGKLFADMSNKSIAEMRKIAQEGQEALDFIQGGKWDAAKGLNLGITEEMFKNFKPEDIEQIRQAIEQLTKSADDCEVGFAKMKTSWEDFVKAKNPKELQEALQGIIDGVNDYMDVASFASDVIGGLGEAFDSDALKGIAEGINVAMDAVNAASQGAQVGAMFGPIGAAAGAAIGLISSLAQSIAEIYDKKKEKQIQALEDDIHDLEIAYDDLGRAIDKAYSTDAAKMIDEQNRMLEEQQRLIREQMQLEEDKKNTDEERIKQWEDELHDIDNQIADNKEAAVDAIYGEDIQSAIENFADAYVGVWSDGSVKIKDVVRQMMQNMVKESIKATLQSSKAMEEIRLKMREFYADKEFQNWEQQELYKMAEEYQKQLDKDYAWAEDLFKDTTAQQASNGGFQAMSQDTGSELNGRFTTMVELQSLQLDKVRSLAIDTATISQNISEMRNLSLLSIGHLESIAKNTHELYQMNYRLGKIEENTSRL